MSDEKAIRLRGLLASVDRSLERANRALDDEAETAALAELMDGFTRLIQAVDILREAQRLTWPECLRELEPNNYHSPMLLAAVLARLHLDKRGRH